MHQNIKKVILFLIGLILLTSLLLSLKIDFTVLSLITRPHYVILAMFFISLLPFITALRMRFLLLTLDDVSRRFKDLAIVEFITMFVFSTAPAKLFLPTKALLLNKLCNTKMNDGLSIAAFEYAFDVGVVLLLTMLGIILYFKDIPHISILKFEFILSLIIGLILLFFYLPSNIFDNLVKKAEQIHIRVIKDVTTRILRTVIEIRSTWISLISNKKILIILPITFISWIVLTISIEFLFLSVNYPVSLFWILIITASSVFIGGVTAIPGGLGVREASMVFLYGMLGIPMEIGLLVAIGSRLIIIPSLIIGYGLSSYVGINILKNGE